jgi:hypothetical protein
MNMNRLAMVGCWLIQISFCPGLQARTAHLALNADFSGDLVTGTAILRDSATGEPLAGATVYVAVRSTPRDGSDWMGFAVDDRGAAHIVMARLRDRDGNLFSTATVYAEYNTRRQPGWPYNPDYQPVRTDQFVPGGAGDPPTVAIVAIVAFQEVAGSCLSAGDSVRFIANANDPDSLPGRGIEEHYWTITIPGDVIHRTGSSVALDQLQEGSYIVQVVVWDKDGLGTRAVRQFEVRRSQTRPFSGWPPCHAVRQTAQGPSGPNGHIEIECVPPDFQVRWHPADGSSPRFIGQCIWTHGYNYASYTVNACTGDIEAFEWRNEEGYKYGGTRVSDDNCDGLYQADVYRFSPIDNSLYIHIDYYTYPVPLLPFLHYFSKRTELPEIQAPFTLGELQLARARLGPCRCDGSSCTGASGHGETHLMLHGETVPGRLQMRLGETTLDIPTVQSSDLAAIGQSIVSAINANAQLQAQGIVARVLPVTEMAPASSGRFLVLAIENIHQSSVSITLNESQGRLGLLRSTDLPSLTITRTGAQDYLHFAAATATGFQLESGSWAGSTLQWIPLPFPVGTTTNGPQVSVPINRQGTSQFFRLVLTP